MQALLHKSDWDAKVCAMLSPEGFWFAPISAQTHATYLFDNAKDMNDLEAARENLMQESLTTTERYARQRRNQRKQRILQMSNPGPAVPQMNLQSEILNKFNSLAQAIEMSRHQ